MARPTKSAKVLSKCSQTKAEIAARTEQEEKLKGSSNNIAPPAHLTDSQKYIFEYIVDQLKASGILGNLDAYILAQCSIAIDRLQYIETEINERPGLMFNKDILAAKEKYSKDFYRCCNELSLSPQSRAKLSNINIQAKQAAEDPLLKVLRGGANE